MFMLRPRDELSATCRRRERLASAGVRLDGREWKYVAEGGANVLFRHYPVDENKDAGQPSVFHGKLLRVKKCDAEEDPKKALKKRRSAKSNRSMRLLPRTNSMDGDAPTPVPYNAHYPHPAKVLEYATKDILPYLEQEEGEEVQREFANIYEQVAELMEVEQRFLVELNEQLLALETRPEHRRQSQIDVALQCVMVLPDVTLPPPDEDPLMFFDELIESDNSESSSNADKTEDAAATSDQATDQATDEDIEDVETALELEVAAITASTHVEDQAKSNVSNVSVESTTSCSTITAGEPDVNDADEEDEDDTEEDDEDLVIPPRRRRVLSGNCNIFDCCFRNICVEIKPKIGFKPKGALISDIKKRVCRFCMHQHYKRAMGKVEEISEYCPLDLFSRNADRIRKALRALQRTPQNNFKIFVRSNNDEVVNVITGLNADALPKGVAQAKYSCRRKRMGFRHSCQSIGAESDLQLGLLDDHDRLLPDVVELLTEVLLKLDILEDLKKMQLLDHVSVDGVWHLHKLLDRVKEVASGDSTSVTMGFLVEKIRKILSSETIKEEDDVDKEGSLARCVAFLEVALDQVPDMEMVQGIKSWKDITLSAMEEFYRQLVQRFQVATTLKDCSLLLCLRRAVDEESTPAPVPGAHHHALCSNKTLRKKFDHLAEYEHRVVFRDMEFNCVIAIVDLDVKSHKSVDDYYRLDEKIVQHYVRTFGEKLQNYVCVEDEY